MIWKPCEADCDSGIGFLESGHLKIQRGSQPSSSRVQVARATNGIRIRSGMEAYAQVDMRTRSFVWLVPASLSGEVPSCEIDRDVSMQIPVSVVGD